MKIDRSAPLGLPPYYPPWRRSKITHGQNIRKFFRKLLHLYLITLPLLQGPTKNDIQSQQPDQPAESVFAGKFYCVSSICGLIVLQNCSLSIVHPTAFVNLVLMIELDLSHNNIRSETRIRLTRYIYAFNVGALSESNRSFKNPPQHKIIKNMSRVLRPFFINSNNPQPLICHCQKASENAVPISQTFENALEKPPTHLNV